MDRMQIKKKKNLGSTISVRNKDSVDNQTRDQVCYTFTKKGQIFLCTETLQKTEVMGQWTDYSGEEISR